MIKKVMALNKGVIMEKRIKKDGTTQYREMIWINGVCYKSPFCNRISDARKWKSSIQSKRDQMKLHGSDYRESVKTSFEQYSMDWLENKIKPTKPPSTYQNYESVLRVHLIPILGRSLLGEIRRKHGEELVTKLARSGKSAKGINHILGVLKQILNEAERREDITKNPLRNYSGMKVPQLQFKYWSDAEINKFLIASQDHYSYPLFVTALYTGMRKGEIAGLHWDCIDFHKNLITVKRTLDKFGLRENTKNNRIRYVPMNAFLKSILMNHFSTKTDDNLLVFKTPSGMPIDTNHLYRTFRTLQIKAKITSQIRVHDLRHTFASQFMMKGLGSLYDLSQVLGHSDVKMTQRYAHLSPLHLSGVTKLLTYGAEDELSGFINPFLTPLTVDVLNLRPRMIETN
jgi:integrase